MKTEKTCTICAFNHLLTASECTLRWNNLYGYRVKGPELLDLCVPQIFDDPNHDFGCKYWRKMTCGCHENTEIRIHDIGTEV